MNFFLKHLKEQNMSYAFHLVFAWLLALKLFLLLLTALVHGIFPFIFTTRVSKGVKAIELQLQDVE